MRALIICLSFFTASAHAQVPEGFTYGPVFENFGPVAEIAQAMPLPKGVKMKHAFDIAKAAEDGKINRSMESAARFINMHARAGIKQKDIRVALVIHGAATRDAMVSPEGEETPSAPLIAALIANGQRVIVCGQSAAAQGFTANDLQPGVEMALSAMTAHLLLQQDGYTINPF